jgi:hypothetical protein
MELIAPWPLIERARGRVESGMDKSSRSDPLRIQILRIWINIFNIHADMDNPNLIIGGCGVGYGIGEIRRIWIIR